MKNGNNTIVQMIKQSSQQGQEIPKYVKFIYNKKGQKRSNISLYN